MKKYSAASELIATATQPGPLPPIPGAGDHREREEKPERIIEGSLKNDRQAQRCKDQRYRQRITRGCSQLKRRSVSSLHLVVQILNRRNFYTTSLDGLAMASRERLADRSGYGLLARVMWPRVRPPVNCSSRIQPTLPAELQSRFGRLPPPVFPSPRLPLDRQLRSPPEPRAG